jgi:predicted small metal-binding protein
MPALCSLRSRATRRPEVRVIDCNVCGATIKAANDDELAGELSRHMRSEHPDADWDDDQAAELVSGQAYEATDS